MKRIKFSTSMKPINSAEKKLLKQMKSSACMKSQANIKYAIEPFFFQYCQCRILVHHIQPIPDEEKERKGFYKAILGTNRPKNVFLKIIEFTKDFKTKDIFTYICDYEKAALNQIKLIPELNKSKYIVKYYGNYSTDKYCIFITKYYEQGTLLDCIKQKPFSTKKVIKLGHCIAKLYKVFDKNKFLYCDMKPDNIFLTKKEKFKLGDFDLSQVLQEENQNIWALSCAYYQPPEFKAIQDPYQPIISKLMRQRADVYSLGKVMAMAWKPKIFEGDGPKLDSEIIEKCAKKAKSRDNQKANFLLSLLEKMLDCNSQMRPTYSTLLSEFDSYNLQRKLENIIHKNDNNKEEELINSVSRKQVK